MRQHSLQVDGWVLNVTMPFLIRYLFGRNQEKRDEKRSPVDVLPGIDLGSSPSHHTLLLWISVRLRLQLVGGDHALQYF